MKISNDKTELADSPKEKAKTVANNLVRYDRAKKAGFYYECLWILYGFAEDRASAVLYHLGFTSEKNRQACTGCKKIRSQVRAVLGMSPEETKYRFDSFGGKIQRISQAISWAKESDTDLSEYQKTIKKALMHLADDTDFITSLEYLNNTWRNMRNQLTHALMSKDSQASIEAVQLLLEEGYPACRCVDNVARYLKDKHIRKKFNIQ